MLAGVFVVAVVEQGDGVVVALFVGFEGGGAFGDLRDAGGDVHADAVGEVVGRGGEHLVEGGVRLLVLAGLHEPEGGLVEGEGLCASCVVRRRGVAGEGAGLLDGCGASPVEEDFVCR